MEGYDAEYIDGINLAQLRTDLLHTPERVIVSREDLQVAIRELLANLRSYRAAHGLLLGDWAFHNLVYDSARRRLVNVDAKEFCEELHTTDFRLNDFANIEANLCDLTTLISLAGACDEEQRCVRGVLRILDEVRRSGESYSGVYFLAGYHTLTLRGRRFRGQRECAARLAQVPYDFRGKVVADLGCNCGGMLHALADQISAGYGFDFNSDCVNAARAVGELNESRHLGFYTFRSLLAGFVAPAGVRARRTRRYLLPALRLHVDHAMARSD